MQMPLRFLIGNLAWARDGSVWAIYRVKPVSYPYLSAREKLGIHTKTRAALMALPSDSMILSICEQLDPDELIADMVESVDLDRQPVWEDVLDATYDQLADTKMYKRRYYLAFALPNEGTKGSIGGAFGSASAGLSRWFGLPPAPVKEKEIENHRRDAKKIETQLKSFLEIEAVTAAEVRWLYGRSLTRGLRQPFFDPNAWSASERRIGEGSDARVTAPSLANLGEAIFKEGGLDTDEDRPRHRRYLRVESDAGVSYQTFMCISDMPQRFSFPGGGGEWFFHTGVAPFPVDWCARIHSIPNQEAQLKTRRQARQLIGQFGEYEGEVTGAPQSLASAMEGIEEERAYLSNNPSEPELQVTIAFAVGAPTLSELEEKASQLKAVFEPNEYALPRPTGGQLGLYAAMLPGGPRPLVARDYTQFLLPRDLSAGVPFGGAEVGDPRGMLLGFQLDGGTFQPVLFDPGYGPATNRSGSLGAFGALGSGKSFFIKNVAWATLARGGQVLTMDRTVTGEYVDFAQVAPGKSQIVKLDVDSDICLDPLRVFRGDQRVRYTIGFLTLLTGTAPTELEGAVLSEAVRDVAKDPDATLMDVIEALKTKVETDPEARVLWRKLSNFASNDLARLAFGDGRVLSLDADYIVFHAPGLSLPDKETLMNEHLAKQLLPEQVFSQALLYLVAAVARTVTFSNPNRFAAALFDEAWALTSSLQGRQLLLDGIRDGRKHNAAVWLLSQHPNDLGDDQLVHLLGNRFVFRQSRGAAAAALKFLGMDASEGWVEMLETELREGQCMYRDVRDRVGMIQVLAPASEELRHAFDTNPEARRARHEKQAAEAAAALLAAGGGEESDDEDEQALVPAAYAPGEESEGDGEST